MISLIIRRLVSRGRRNKRGRATPAKIAEDAYLDKLEEAINETNDYAGSIEILRQGLEDLKLGAISVDYEIVGLISISGTVGRIGDGFQREIVTTAIHKTHTALYVQAYSYRGYRFSDPDQGGGIDGVVSSAF